ncbi:MAG: alkane 1-monooxygenase [Saprospiraceae bacterium]|nr:alkane 1-monooxygenase [Saprospiraceae bacterium]MCB0622769.1 alkane 1-monooxygenase [Saprospiraceae bacterium]MCB0675174.1 alkane 1-monooxygenase [Saprospiraceae bacterium]MCB0679513.1 alkane 1-monooxygenase [Saprospiraceae bacterium]
MLKDAKYLLAYVAPLAAYLGIYVGGAWSFGSIYVGFVLIPLLEFLLPGSSRNLTPEEEGRKSEAHAFDLLLYLNVPVLFGLLWYYYRTLAAGGSTGLEITGMTFSVGLIVGTIGINVAHELGHRQTAHEPFLAKLLLMTGLYMHFIIEHNRGHHRWVATPADPASARLGESLYRFWFRSVSGGYVNAWKLEAQRLKQLGLPAWHWRNEMIWFQLIQLGYLSAVGALFGWNMVVFALAVAVIGFLMLESVNYIEHYGLRRRRLDNGRYENVRPAHSWNSNHELGRIFLYELTRHSDHHYKATRKYQVLRHFEESPQLPQGYPASILLALAPPLWFAVMDRRVREVEAAYS